MTELDRAKNNIEDKSCIRNNDNAFAKASSNNINLLGKFDGEAIIQAIVMSELLSKPKAKRRKRGHI